MTELKKWIGRRKGVWKRKLEKVRNTTPEGAHHHLDLHTQERTALRVLEELDQIQVVINNSGVT